ncbi:filamentous hemagglutinin N-terminal domain-containing protein [Pseudopelagicola sp. nBUS_19]|uniref:two-partner secretion domain-containing protein n=1 Tax=Pseudopelagicola sp. nBUS_19 TaxID=3395316 RepID=UPI003EBF1CF0
MITPQMKIGSIFHTRLGSKAVLDAKGIMLILLFSGLAACFCLPAIAQTLPTGGTVASGDVSISQQTANSMTINQGSSSAVVNWDSFSIGQNNSVDIHQPDTQSSILNRVTGSTTSEIHGRLTSNGQVHIVNPNGIYIGPSGTVNTAAFVASTLGISDSDFLAGRLRFKGTGNSATVENAGRVTIGKSGYAALLGGRVRNSGIVTVPFGRIGFASGERVTLDLTGDQFLQVTIPTGGEDGDKALIDHSGLASADGGLIEMRAATARQAVRHAVNLSGVAEARSVSQHNGTIFLGGGGQVNVSGRVSTREKDVTGAVTASMRPRERPEILITGNQITLSGANIDASHSDGGGLIRIGGDFAGQGDLLRATTTTVDAKTAILADSLGAGDGGRIVVWSDLITEFSGELSARGGPEGGNGGFIEVSSPRTLKYSGKVDTRAPAGSWGTLLLDPSDITINSGADERSYEDALSRANVILTTSTEGSDPGDITINADLDWDAGTSLTLIADNDIILNGAINGSSGSFGLQATGTITTTSAGTVDVDEFTLTNGDWEQVGSLPAFSADSFVLSGGQFLRASSGSGGSGTPYIIEDIFGLQGVGSISNVANYELSNDIDASGTANWQTGSVNGFASIGTLDGTLDGAGYKISDLSISGSALIGTISSAGTVTDLTLENASGSAAGILAQYNNGTIRNVQVSGDLDASDYAYGGGGVVASNTGLIEDSISSVDVIATNPSGKFFGGFVGQNTGTINRAHSLGTVTVNDPEKASNIYAGGFVGSSDAGKISDSYSQGDVKVSDASSAVVGGFAAVNDATINRSYSTGMVETSGSNSSTVGGFLGLERGTSSGNFWDSDTSGLATSASGTALTTSQFQDAATFYGLGTDESWNFSSIWAPGDTGYYPANYSTTLVVFAIPDDLTVQFGLTGTATTTGSVFGGPDYYVFGKSSDTLDTSGIFQTLSFASRRVGTTTFTVDTSNISSTNGIAYRVVGLAGDAEITVAPPDFTPRPGADALPRLGEFIGIGFENPKDRINASIPVRERVKETLDAITGISEGFVSQAQSCTQSGKDTDRYLACLSDALYDLTDEVDAISADLPPSMQNVAEILKGARLDVDQARIRAQKRLANASTDAERQAIRADAANEARAALSNASGEIRKAISLVRVEDPELASLQSATITVVADAVDTVGIELSRAVGL